MKYERFQQSIDRCLSSVELRPELRSEILKKCSLAADPAPKRTFRKVIFLRKFVACVAVLCIVFATGLICVASGLPLHLPLMRLGSEIAMMLTPNTTSISNGIEMNVVAAMSDQEEIVVYLTLRDTEQKGRLDDTLQLVDFSTESTRLGQEAERVFSHAEVLWYDPQTQTATLRLIGQGLHGIENSKFSLSVRALLAGREEYSSIATGYTLADVCAFNPLPTVSYPADVSSYSTSGLLSEKLSDLVEQGKMPVLNKNEQAPFSVAQFPWFEVENIAVVDNFLHVRVAYDQDMGRFNQLYLQLGKNDKNDDAAVLETSELSMDIAYYEPDDQHRYPALQEQIIAIPGEMLYQDIGIFADVITYDQYLEGSWDATFEIENAQEYSVTQECSIDMDTWTIDRVTISPIGVSVSGKGELLAYSVAPNIIVKRVDGSTIECNSSSVTTNEDSILFKNIFETPLKTEDIECVIINDVSLSFFNAES